MKTPFLILTAAALAAVAVFAMVAAEPTADKGHKLQSVSVRKMADSLHAVIAADRQAYAEMIVPRGDTNAPGLPTHAQLLRHAAQNIQKRGAEFSYTLRSLWPISANNGPQTEIEQAGLEAVAKDPERAFYTEEELGGRSYFTAIYADRATLPSCVSCHNRHPRSPKRDFKSGDVMGAIVVRVPLEF